MKLGSGCLLKLYLQSLWILLWHSWWSYQICWCLPCSKVSLWRFQIRSYLKMLHKECSLHIRTQLWTYQRTWILSISTPLDKMCTYQAQQCKFCSWSCKQCSCRWKRHLQCWKSLRQFLWQILEHTRHKYQHCNMFYICLGRQYKKWNLDRNLLSIIGRLHLSSWRSWWDKQYKGHRQTFQCQLDRNCSMDYKKGQDYIFRLWK